MIWEPFVLALVLGLVVSAGLYFAYLWPSIEHRQGEPDDTTAASDAPIPEAPAPASSEGAS